MSIDLTNLRTGTKLCWQVHSSAQGVVKGIAVTVEVEDRDGMKQKLCRELTQDEIDVAILNLKGMDTILKKLFSEAYEILLDKLSAPVHSENEPIVESEPIEVNPHELEAFLDSKEAELINSEDSEDSENNPIVPNDE